MRDDAARNGEGYKITPPPAAAFAVNAQDAAWVDAMCVKQPLATFEQKLEVSGPQVPKRVYMFAAGWEPSPFQQFAARFKDDRGWQYVSFSCGHDVMIDQPAGTCRRADRRRLGSAYDAVIVSFTFATSAASAKGFGRKANCWFSGRLFSKASSA